MSDEPDDHELVHWRAALAEQPTGWDVGGLTGYHEQDPPWSWVTLVGNLAPMSDRVLDLGTGDGEILATLVDVLPEGTVATAGRRPHLPAARDRLAPLGIEVHDHDADRPGSRLPFAADTFDLVLCRQESYDPQEVARVLAPGGSFLTQQVGGDDLCELDDAFAIDPPCPEATLENAVHDLTRAGLTVERSDTFHGTARFEDMESLLGYLRRVPRRGPDGLDADRHRRELEALAQHLRTGPLSMSTSRFLVLARARALPTSGAPTSQTSSDDRTRCPRSRGSDRRPGPSALPC